MSWTFITGAGVRWPAEGGIVQLIGRKTLLVTCTVE